MPFITLWQKFHGRSFGFRRLLDPVLRGGGVAVVVCRVCVRLRGCPFLWCVQISGLVPSRRLSILPCGSSLGAASWPWVLSGYLCLWLVAQWFVAHGLKSPGVLGPRAVTGQHQQHQQQHQQLLQRLMAVMLCNCRHVICNFFVVHVVRC